MKKIGHIKTVINTVFGEFDEEGDLVKTFPVSLEVTKLVEQQWGEALKALTQCRADITDGKVQPQQPQQ